MKAMILAAGLGTRLKPITDKIPKALVEVDGVPMIERVILNLKSQGFDSIVVNTHHFSQQIKDFLRKKHFDIEIEISDETEELLDTGGGIVKAAELLFKNESDPVLIHNVDILSNASLRDLMEQSDGETTVLVSKRDSSRKLIFNDDMRLTGWHDLKNNKFKPEILRNHCELKEFSFSGIYVISRDSVLEMKKLMGEGKFSIVDYFVKEGRSIPIKGICKNDLILLDIGKPAALSQASKFI